MKPVKTEPRLRGGDKETDQTGQEAIELLIDEVGAQSFPASDPPAWGSVSSRLEQAKRNAGQ